MTAKISNTIVNMDVYRLYKALYAGKQNLDISAYEQKVFAFYSGKLAEYTSVLPLKFNTCINSAEELEIALTNASLLKDVLGALHQALQEAADFREMTTILPSEPGLCQSAFTKQLQKILTELKSLPRTDVMYGKELVNNPSVLLTTRIHPVDQVYLLGMLGNDKKEARARFNQTEDPWSDKDLRTMAKKRATEFLSSHPGSILSIDDVINAYAEEIRQQIQAEKMAHLREIKKKRISFWTGFGIWAAFMATAAILLFAVDAFPLTFKPYVESGFWTNVGRFFLYFDIIVIILIGTGHAYFFFKETRKLRAVPRGLASLVCTYYTFFSDYTEKLESYSIPYYIFGGAMIVVAVFFDFYSPPSSAYEANKKPFQTHKGFIFYSPIHSITPVACLCLFTTTFETSYIVTTWFVLIFTLIFLIAHIFEALDIIF